jgi:hypothetical protein
MPAPMRLSAPGPPAGHYGVSAWRCGSPNSRGRVPVQRSEQPGAGLAPARPPSHFEPTRSSDPLAFQIRFIGGEQRPPDTSKLRAGLPLPQGFGAFRCRVPELCHARADPRPAFTRSFASASVWMVRPNDHVACPAAPPARGATVRHAPVSPEHLTALLAAAPRHKMLGRNGCRRRTNPASLFERTLALTH